MMDREEPVFEALDVLYESPGLPAFDMPDDLRRLYRGSLGFAEPRVFANFVSTLDGVVAIPSLAKANELISGGSAADRFVMGLLRSLADAVIIGSGTLGGSPRGTWTAQGAYPEAAESYSAVRRTLHRSPWPEVVVLTRSGSLDTTHPLFEKGALVVTTDRGESMLRGRLPHATAVVSLGVELDPREAFSLLGERGHSLVLTESGPTLFGALLEANVVDELFLTLSPLLAGRPPEGDRLQLVEGVALLPDWPVDGRLLSARASGSQLFLRYELRRRSPGSPASGSS